MGTKRKTYSAEFKAKVVLEVLEANETLNQIASKYELLPANVKNWKKLFLENMSLAFDKSTVVKEDSRYISKAFCTVLAVVVCNLFYLSIPKYLLSYPWDTSINLTAKSFSICIL